jgi:hypothetical protein
MLFGRALSGTWKLALLLITLGAVVYFLLIFREWSTDWTEFFFRTDNWGMIVLVTLIITAVSMLFILLFRWEFKAFARPERRRRR